MPLEAHHAAPESGGEKKQSGDAPTPRFVTTMQQAFTLSHDLSHPNLHTCKTILGLCFKMGQIQAVTCIVLAASEHKVHKSEQSEKAKEQWQQQQPSTKDNVVDDTDVELHSMVPRYNVVIRTSYHSVLIVKTLHMRNLDDSSAT